MQLIAGTTLGPYEILALLGVGGMGEVYRARDPRLGREVAIKILPPQYSEHADRIRRFEQEARAAGILNHPNILTIYDVGTHEGSVFIVSELLVGENLREKMGGSPLSQRKAVEYALQISHGLAAAHERGIIHRDLKPENLFITRDGRIKILDFGLAKLTHPESPEKSASKLPTLDPGTEPGVVLGTAAYMSPEQVRGQPVDHRSDLFSFGAILYEMLTGTRAFHRNSAADTLSAILKEDPPELSATNKSFAPALDRILRHCLEKNVEQRFQSSRDLAFDLEMISGVSGSAVSGPSITPISKKRFFQPVLLAFVILSALSLGYFAGKRALPVTNTIKAPATTPTYTRLTFQRGYVSMAQFAPDGQSIIYSAEWNGRAPEIFTTRVQSYFSRSLQLSNADLLSISKSGEMAILLNPRSTLGFQRTGTLARVPIDGGAPREILENVQDADWASDGTLAVLRNLSSGVHLEFPPGKVLHQISGWMSSVRISPDGKQIAFLEHPQPGDDRGWVSIVDRAGHRKVLTKPWATVSSLAWSKDGNEIWFTASKEGFQNPLYAVNLSGNLRTVSAMTGNLILHDIAANGNILLSADSRRREMIVLPPGESHEQDLTWLDWSFPRDLSNDGNWIVFEEEGEGGGPNYSAYLRKTDGSPAVRLGDGYALALSRDGTRVISSLPGQYAKPVLLSTRVGEPQPIRIESVRLNFGARWFPDGNRILLQGSEPNLLLRCWVYDLVSKKIKAVTPEAIGFPAIISPDARFILARSTGEGYALYPVDGGQPEDVRGIAKDEIPMNWTADGKSIWIRSAQKPISIFRVNLADGQRTLWKEIRPNDPAGILGTPGVLITPDGKVYAYTYRRILSDLYLAQDLR